MSTAPASAPGVLDLGAEESAARLALVVGRLNRLLRPAGSQLSPGLLMALSTIARKGPIKPSTLGRIEGVSAPATTRVIDELVRRGLAEKVDDPDDGRSFFVSATGAGQQAVQEARSERAEHASQLLEGLSPDERALLVSALPALEKAAGAAIV